MSVLRKSKELRVKIKFLQIMTRKIIKKSTFCRLAFMRMSNDDLEATGNRFHPFSTVLMIYQPEFSLAFLMIYYANEACSL